MFYVYSVDPELVEDMQNFLDDNTVRGVVLEIGSLLGEIKQYPIYGENPYTEYANAQDAVCYTNPKEYDTYKFLAEKFEKEVENEYPFKSFKIIHDHDIGLSSNGITFLISTTNYTIAYDPIIKDILCVTKGEVNDPLKWFKDVLRNGCNEIDEALVDEAFHELETMKIMVH